MSTQENLEERIERIRKRNEELQKKHAEAEADKQRAKKENAMVQTKLTNYDDWPREHKYDNVEFTFDNNEENNHLVSDEIRDKRREKHNKSQFAEGDGPPPDPSYSFLKDADRDFNHIEQMRNKTNASKKAPHSNQRNQQRGNVERGNFRENSRGKPRGKDYGHNDSQPAYDAWRCERNKIDEARINRQKNSEGKWRREWDIEKINNDGPKEIFNAHKPEKYTIGDVLLTGSKKPIVAHPNLDKPKDFNRARPNITVSLGRSGEVQSVKVSSPPAIGSGRVGPRHVKSRPSFPDDVIDDQKMNLNDNHKPILLEQNKKKVIIKSLNNTDVGINAAKGVQDRLNKFKKHNDFTKISKELKNVSQDIQGICTSVEKLNKKHMDVHQNDISLDETISIDNILKINKKEKPADDFCLSTDLITGTTNCNDSDQHNIKRIKMQFC